MTLAEELNSKEMDGIINSMTAYVLYKFQGLDIKDLEGKESVDIVFEILLKVVEGERDWSKANCTFKEFLFGCLRSHLHNFFKKFQYRFESELSHAIPAVDYDVTEKKNAAIDFLKENGCDKLELNVFECWVDGVNKPSEIAKELNRDVSTINNTIKRLLRKLPALRIFQNNFYERGR